MRNKKTILIIFCIAFTTSFLFCTPAQFKINIIPEFGFINGTITENVWNVDVKTSDNKRYFTPTTLLSRLDWQLQNAPYLGGEVQLFLNNVFVLDTKFYGGIPGDFGIMEDYDWEKRSEPDHLTKYSKHTNNLISFNQFKFDFGYSFIPKIEVPVRITPKIGLSWFSFDFAGRGGYRTYEEDNWNVRYFSDTVVIEYKQSYIAPRLSLYTTLNENKTIEVEVGQGISYVSKFNAYDLHAIRNLYFNDRIQDAWILDYEIKILAKINEHNKIGIKGTLNSMLDSIGFTYYKNTSKTDSSASLITDSIGGTYNTFWKYALVYVYSF